MSIPMYEQLTICVPVCANLEICDKTISLKEVVQIFTNCKVWVSMNLPKYRSMSFALLTLFYFH